MRTLYAALQGMFEAVIFGTCFHLYLSGESILGVNYRFMNVDNYAHSCRSLKKSVSKRACLTNPSLLRVD